MTDLATSRPPIKSGFDCVEPPANLCELIVDASEVIGRGRNEGPTTTSRGHESGLLKVSNGGMDGGFGNSVLMGESTQGRELVAHGVRAVLDLLPDVICDLHAQRPGVVLANSHLLIVPNSTIGHLLTNAIGRPMVPFSADGMEVDMRSLRVDRPARVLRLAGGGWGWRCWLCPPPLDRVVSLAPSWAVAVDEACEHVYGMHPRRVCRPVEVVDGVRDERETSGRAAA